MTRHALSTTILLAAQWALTVGPLEAQQPVDSACAGPPAWSFNASAGLYLPSDGDDYLQPTVTADRGRLHLESRYNWEDRESLSFFLGTNFDLGDEVTLLLTPMIGGVVGQTQGIVPALNLDLSWGPLELLASPEYVFDLHDTSSSYFYVWSELSLWLTEWLRAGVAVQRTRVRGTERDVEAGVLVGASIASLEGVFYLFNPGQDDRMVMLSLALEF